MMRHYGNDEMKNVSMQEIENSSDSSLASQGQNEVLSMDEYISRVGECGWFQVRTQILFFSFALVFTAQIFVPYFTVHDPPWRCVKNSSVCTYNETITSQSPLFQHKCKFDRREWKFTKPKTYSIVTQFDLVCKRESYAIIANSIAFVGWGFGGIVLAYISDQLGRKKTIYFSAVAVITCTIISALVVDHIVYIASRFFIGLFLGGGLSIIFIVAAEIAGSQFRAISCTLIWVYFTLTLVIMTFTSYLLEDWKKLELIVSTPFLVLLFTWWCFPESIRWLKLQGRTLDAEKLLKEIAKLNKKDIPNASLAPEKVVSTKSSIFCLFWPYKLLVQTSVQGVSWFTAGLTYYAISLSSQDLSGNFYKDFLLTSLVELPSNFAVIYCSDKFGRKRTVIGNFIITAVACLVVALNHSKNIVFQYMRLTAGLVGKFAAATYFNSFYIWSAELHPTEVRAQALGFFVVMSRIGASLSPFIITILKQVLISLPFYLMAILNMLMGILCFTLTETKDKEMADSVEEYLQSFQSS